MEKVDIILHGGTVLTMNRDFDLIFDGAVAVRGSDIVAVGSTQKILAAYEAAEMVDCAGQYILPGLVNAHTHVPMTLLRGLADDLRLDVWLMGYIMPTEREFVSPEFCRLGTKLACAEQIRSGITAFADMYYFEADIASATAEAGMRGVLGQTILKFPHPMPKPMRTVWPMPGALSRNGAIIRSSHRRSPHTRPIPAPRNCFRSRLNWRKSSMSRC